MLLTFIDFNKSTKRKGVLLEFLDFVGKRLYNMLVHNGSL